MVSGESAGSRVIAWSGRTAHVWTGDDLHTGARGGEVCVIGHDAPACGCGMTHLSALPKVSGNNPFIVHDRALTRGACLLPFCLHASRSPPGIGCFVTQLCSHRRM